MHGWCSCAVEKRRRVAGRRRLFPKNEKTVEDLQMRSENLVSFGMSATEILPRVCPSAAILVPL